MKIYQVGGCVRDKILGISPKDFDFVVVGSSFQKMLDSGFVAKKANIPVFLHPQTKQEYTLARKDIKTGPKHTDFDFIYPATMTIEEDLIRRDFTCNAIAYDELSKSYIDPFNGIQDIENKTLKCVDNKAFNDDPLRVIRMCRFAAQLDFSIDKETMELAQQNKDIKYLSKERIWEEIYKALQYPTFWKFIESFYKSTAWEKFFGDKPEDITSIIELEKLSCFYSAQQKWLLLCTSCPEFSSLPCRKKFRPLKTKEG